MNITEVTRLAGADKKRYRVGRGPGSGSGKTSGRGHKGTGQRAGSGIRRLFEGGNMPLFMRLPKVGFSNFRFTKRFHIVNVGDLQEVFDEGTRITPDLLAEARLIRNTDRPIKVLGDGELSKKLVIEAHKFSKKAAERIAAAGGEAVRIPTA